MAREPHAQLLDEAIALEARAHERLLAGEDPSEAFRAAAERYRTSWEASPPRAFGRLVGELKASVLAGDAAGAARYARAAIGAEPDSPTSAYAVAIAALVEGDDDVAARAAEAMRGGSDAFVRAADAIAAIAARDQDAFVAAVKAIVVDFETRAEHLTGVAIADTALMLERLGAARGLASGVASPLLGPSS